MIEIFIELLLLLFFQPYYHQWLMHVLTCMARPAEKQVPMSYFDFMTKDSVRIFISCAIVISLFFVSSTEVEVVRSVQFVSYFFVLSFFLWLCLLAGLLQHIRGTAWLQSTSRHLHYITSNQPISLKLGIVIGLTNQKNRSTFGGDSVLSVDSGSFFYFLVHFGILDFKRFITISRTVTV